MHGGALGSKPEAITGIPPKVNTEQRVEQPLSLTVVSVWLGMSPNLSSRRLTLDYILSHVHVMHSLAFCLYAKEFATHTHAATERCN